MLVLFFTLIVIAEVIIAAQLIFLIRRVDFAVIAINNKICESSPNIKNTISKVRNSVNKALIGVYNLGRIIEKRKDKTIKYFIKNAITTILFFMLSPNGKQILTAIDLFFTSIEFIDRIKERETA